MVQPLLLTSRDDWATFPFRILKFIFSYCCCCWGWELRGSTCVKVNLKPSSYTKTDDPKYWLVTCNIAVLFHLKTPFLAPTLNTTYPKQAFYLNIPQLHTSVTANSSAAA